MIKLQFSRGKFMKVSINIHLYTHALTDTFIYIIYIYMKIYIWGYIDYYDYELKVYTSLEDNSSPSD